MLHGLYSRDIVTSAEYCHMDPDDGLLVMLQGRKHVRLYGCDPEPLYPNALGSKGRTVQSQVNSDDPDLEQHPLYADVTCQECTLNPGEMSVCYPKVCLLLRFTCSWISTFVLVTFASRCMCAGRCCVKNYNAKPFLHLE